MRIAFDARMEGAERADWWRALTDALPDDDWVDAAVDGTASPRWREEIGRASCRERVC